MVDEELRGDFGDGVEPVLAFDEDGFGLFAHSPFAEDVVRSDAGGGGCLLRFSGGDGDDVGHGRLESDSRHGADV